MNRIEKIAHWARHESPLRNSGLLWRLVRPAFNKFCSALYPHGLPRRINGTDSLRLAPRLRMLPDSYEPDVWPKVMRELRPGDIFVDVGAFLGLYAIAGASRVAPNGKVYAFEPDRENLKLLTENARLNHPPELLVVAGVAASSVAGRFRFTTGKACESHLQMGEPGEDPESLVETVRLDDYFKSQRVDVIKVDVEGFELEVLKGARAILKRGEVRAVFIEMHPFAWGRSGASSEAILSELAAGGYGLFDLAGEPLNTITEYGEAVARRI